jgi:hypothetical protein
MVEIKDDKWLIMARNDVGKPYIHAVLDSYIDALQMHYYLEDNDKLDNQIVELKV